MEKQLIDCGSFPHPSDWDWDCLPAVSPAGMSDAYRLQGQIDHLVNKRHFNHPAPNALWTYYGLWSNDWLPFETQLCLKHSGSTLQAADRHPGH